MGDNKIPDGKVDEVVKQFREQFALSVEFCDPYFQLAARLYALWRGRKPWQLTGTSSQIMLNMAFGLCQDRLPRLKKNLFNGEDFISLEAIHPRYEYGREQAEAWIRNLLKDESQLNILADIEPTLQSAVTMGTGYRMPFARKAKDGRWQVTSRDVEFFQILPAPVGGKINPFGGVDADDCLPHFFYVDWMNNDQIEKLSMFPGAQKDEIKKCLESKIENKGELDDNYHEIFSVIGGVNYGESKNDWRTKFNDSTRGVKSGRRRVVH
jgi:hypothetical protein